MLNLNFNPFPIIHTERLVLREITDDDLPEIFFQRSDPRMMKYVDRAPACSMDDAREFFVRVKTAQLNNEGINWGITLKNEQRLIGTIGIWRIEAEHHRAEIGYALHPEHQGKGIMHEALKAVLDFGFHTMNLHSIEANVNPNNAASIKLLECAGFIREAYFKENYFFNGKYLDSAIYSLISPIES